MTQTKCPFCGKKPVRTFADGTHVCSGGHLFDSDPDEGGSYSSDPSRRLEQQEERDKARRENLARRSRASGGFRFGRRQ